jgi:hypothetical protein
MNVQMKGITALSLTLVLMGVLGLPGAQAQSMYTRYSTGPAIKGGVSAAFLEHNAGLAITRLEAKPNGGVCLTHGEGFKPDEVLVIDNNNEPRLMAMGPDGRLVDHPTRVAGVHQNDLIIMDKAVNLRDLADNLLPTITYDEAQAVTLVPCNYNGERAVSYQTVGSTPVTAADFNRPLPAATGFEREVAYSCPNYVLPGGWRTVPVGNSVLILDQRGVIQDAIP